MTRLFLAFLGLLGTLSCVAKADIVLYETNFDSYADGNLVGQDLWGAHSGGGTLPVQVNGGSIGLVHGASAEDVSRDIGAIMGAGDKWMYSIDVNVQSYSVPYYFAHFKDAGSGFNGRLHLVDATGGGDFTFGVSDVGSDGGATASFATDFSLNTTYRVNVVYDFDLGVSTVTVDGFAGAITSVDSDLSQAMQAIAFRQTSAGANDSSIMTIDNLVVTAVPEPSSLALVGLAGVLGFVRRRK